MDPKIIKSIRLDNYQWASFFGVKISMIQKNELFEIIQNAIRNTHRLRVGNVNIYAMNLAWENPSFRDILNSFEIVFCDGFGVKWGGQFLGLTIPERFTPPDFIHSLMQIVVAEKGGVYILGADPSVAEKAANTLVQHTPDLLIAGTRNGYFDKSAGSLENESVITSINNAHPSLLLVGFGMPLQEEWIAANWEKLNVPVVMTVGALFDTLSGSIHRGSRFFTDHGLEWLVRLIVEPRRLWKRYIIGNPLFFWRIFKLRFRIVNKD